MSVRFTIQALLQLGSFVDPCMVLQLQEHHDDSHSVLEMGVIPRPNNKARSGLQGVRYAEWD